MMRTPSIIPQKGPEAIIQQKIIEFLTLRGWYVRSTHGNVYSNGWPDLYACHPKYGTRWIEVKQPVGYSFTPAQRIDFPLFEAHGAKIWVLCDATESEYQKLWKQSNWSHYLMMMNIRGCK